MFRKKETPKPTTFSDFVILLPYLTDENTKKNLEYLNKAEKPDFIFGKELPNDLNLITFGQYSDLCDAVGNENHVTAISEMVKALFPDVTEDMLGEATAYDVWGMCNWIVGEVGRINQLFENVHLEYTEQEKKAGIEKMQFGTFGILDWYARRMGITDQDKVNSEKWVRIYTCMKNDTAETDFNRRLQKVYENESKNRHK